MLHCWPELIASIYRVDFHFSQLQDVGVGVSSGLLHSMAADPGSELRIGVGWKLVMGGPWTILHCHSLSFSTPPLHIYSHWID